MAEKELPKESKELKELKKLLEVKRILNEYLEDVNKGLAALDAREFTHDAVKQIWQHIENSVRNFMQEVDIKGLKQLKDTKAETLVFATLAVMGFDLFLNSILYGIAYYLEEERLPYGSKSLKEAKEHIAKVISLFGQDMKKQ